MNEFTNILLMTLIALLGAISKIFYDKMDRTLQKIEDILISDKAQEKDIESLQEDVKDHEVRIITLEKNQK